MLTPNVFYWKKPQRPIEQDINMTDIVAGDDKKDDDDERDQDEASFE